MRNAILRNHLKLKHWTSFSPAVNFPYLKYAVAATSPQIFCSLLFFVDSLGIADKVKSVLLYIHSQAKRRLHTRHLRSRTSLHNLISVDKQKSSIPIKFPFHSPMIFPPYTYYLALVRVVKNKKIQEKFSCLAIFLSVTEVVRPSRNCATQILNFVSCSDWFSRNIISRACNATKNPALPQREQMLH